MPDGGGDERPRLRLVRWRKVHRGHLVGFADVELPIGLKITDVMVIAKAGKVFCNLPSRPRLRTDAKEHLEIDLDPVEADPIPSPAGMRPWEPWPADLAASIFLGILKDLSSGTERVTAS